MLRPRYPMFVIAMMGIVACNDNQPPTGPNLDGSSVLTARAEMLASATGRIERGIEDDILRMESYVPGLGGAFIENDEIIVLVPPTAERSNVLRGLARASSLLTVDPATRGLLARGERIQLRTANYAFSQLVVWEKLLGSDLAKRGIVSFTDANEGLNKISIGLVLDAYRDEVLSRASDLGIPLDAIVVVVREMETAATTLRDAFLPTGSGVQISNPNDQVCTLGWNIHRGADAPDGEEGFFTAGHCASAVQPGTGVTGAMFQATTSNRIGFITQNLVWNVQNPGCDYSYCTQVDAMYVKYDDPSESAKRLAQTQYAGTNNGGGSHDWSGWWTDLSGTNYSFFQGATVDKMGRTTGWTRGTLVSTCTKTNVTSSAGHDPYTVLCADKVSGARAGEGDSGGPVFQIAAGGVIVPHGVLFSVGGNMVFNSEGLRYCDADCIYSYSRMTRINMYLPPPPY